MGRSAEAEGGTWVLEESATAGLWQAGQSEMFTGGLCITLRASASDVCLPVWTGGLVCNVGFGEQTPTRGGLLLAARRQPEGIGVRSSTTRNAAGRSPECCRSEAPLLSEA